MGKVIEYSDGRREYELPDEVIVAMLGARHVAAPTPAPAPRNAVVAVNPAAPRPAVLPRGARAPDSIPTRIINTLQAAPDRVWTLAEIAEATGANVRQVRSTAARLARENDAPILNTGRGQYRAVPEVEEDVDR